MWSLLLIQDVSLPWNSVLHGHETNCFIPIQGVSWPWKALFHCDPFWFKVFHDLETHCFNLIQGESWLRNKMFHTDSTCLTVFLGHETNYFFADSSWFNLFHRCFNTVSLVGTSLMTNHGGVAAIISPTLRRNTSRRHCNQKPSRRRFLSHQVVEH